LQRFSILRKSDFFCYLIFFFLKGCGFTGFAEIIASFHSENNALVVIKNINFITEGKMYFVFILPEYACEKPMENGRIYIKIGAEVD